MWVLCCGMTGPRLTLKNQIALDLAIEHANGISACTIIRMRCNGYTMLKSLQDACCAPKDSLERQNRSGAYAPIARRRRNCRPLPRSLL